MFSLTYHPQAYSIPSCTKQIYFSVCMGISSVKQQKQWVWKAYFETAWKLNFNLETSTALKKKEEEKKERKKRKKEDAKNTHGTF